nr:hypothetical protein [Tanacetum cinerariifolium]
ESLQSLQQDNKRTRVIMESTHVNFDELPSMASVQNSSDPALTRHSMASVHNSTDPGPTRHSMASVHNSTDPGPTRHSMASVHNSTDPGPTRHSMASIHNSTDPGLTRHSMASTHNSSDPGPTPADAPNQRQQPATPLNNHTTPVPTCPNPPITTSVISSENINQAEPHAENDQVAD